MKNSLSRERERERERERSDRRINSYKKIDAVAESRCERLNTVTGVVSGERFDQCKCMADVVALNW